MKHTAKRSLVSRWKSINKRCNNPKNKDYKYYGDRGIKNNFKDFQEFYEWALRSGYKEHLTIDRIDNNKGYSSSNCRWATLSEQMLNRRFTNQPRVSGLPSFCSRLKSGKIQIIVSGKYIGTCTEQEAHKLEPIFNLFKTIRNSGVSSKELHHCLVA